MTPAAALVERVQSLHRDTDTLTFATDVESYPGKVLLALWLPAGTCVITIDAKEYDGLKMAKIFGFPDALPPSALQRTKAQKAPK